jgi:hypothetical protein
MKNSRENYRWLKYLWIFVFFAAFFFLSQNKKSYAMGIEIVTPTIITPQTISIDTIHLQTVSLDVVTPMTVTPSSFSMDEVSPEIISPETVRPEIIVGEKVNVEDLVGVQLNNLYIPEAQNQWNAVSYVSLSKKLMAPFGIKGLVPDPLMSKLFPGLQKHEEVVAEKAFTLPVILYSIDNHLKAQG